MFTSREMSMSTMNYVVILREEASARTEEERSQPERCPTLAGPLAICWAGGGLILLRSWNPNAPLPCSQGSWKLGRGGGRRGLYPQKQIPVATIPEIFISLSYMRQSFPVICWYCISALESCKIIPLLSVCLNMREKTPLIWNSCLMSAILPPSSVWAGLLCAAHIFRMTRFQVFRASVFKSTGERRQQSSAGWCLPRCGLITGWSDGCWHETWFPLGVHPAWTVPLKPEAICHLLILFQHCPCHR